MYQVNITIRAITVVLAVTLTTSVVGAVEPSATDDGSNRIPELDCVIEPSEIVDVGSAVPGVVESILVDRNDQIAKGTIIARLEASVERANLELSRERANLNTAIELRKEGARFGHLTENRSLSLRKTASISQQELDTVVSETRIAELQVRQERDNKRLAGLELLRAEALLDRRTIRSPVDGVVVDRFKAAGEYVDEDPVMRVVQLDPLHVEVILSTDYLGRIKPGMQAQVTPTIPQADTYLATVERVDRVSDAASGTYGVRLSLANSEYKIPAGLRCRLGFIPQVPAGVAAVTETTGGVEEPEVTEVAAIAKVTDVVAEFALSAVEQDIPAADPPVTEPSEQAVAADESRAESDQAVSIEQFIPVSESVQVSQKSQPGSCHVIGPFTRESVAREWFDRLQNLSGNMALRDERVSVEEAYTVFAKRDPAQKSLSELLSRLEEAGISDRYVVMQGERKGQVSLGVYNSHRYAVRRKEALAAEGFKTEIIPCCKLTSQYWLDLSIPFGSELPKWVAQHSSNPSAKSVICSEQVAQR